MYRLDWVYNGVPNKVLMICMQVVGGGNESQMLL